MQPLNVASVDAGQQPVVDSQASTAIAQTLRPTLRRSPQGGYYIDRTDDDPLFVCQDFEVVGLVGLASGEETLLMEFTNRSGRNCCLQVRRRDLLRRSDKVIGDLAAADFDMTFEPRYLQLLKEFLYTLRPSSSRTAVTRPGWVNDTFVQPGFAFGPAAGQLFYAGDEGDNCELRQSGSSADWSEQIAQPCTGSLLAVLALCAAFAGALAGLLGVEPFGFHVYGESATGKSSLAKLANSIWGGKERIRSWHMSQAGLERLARAYHDGFLVLDEIAQVPARLLAPLVYQLGNGLSRTLASSGGGELLRMIYFSTGEVALGEMLGQQHTSLMGGHTVRQINLPVSAAGHAGLFGQPPAGTSAGERVEALNRRADQYHGTPMIEFLSRLGQLEPAALRDRFAQSKKAFTATLEQGERSGMHRRVAGHFSLCAFAGDLATEWGLTGWQPELASEAARQMFAVWCETQRSPAQEKLVRLVDQVQLFLINQLPRIVDKDRGAPKVKAHKNPIGFKLSQGDNVFHCLRAPVFTGQALRDFDPAEACRLLIEAGLLVPNHSTGAAYQTLRFPIHNSSDPARGYRLKNIMAWEGA